MLWLALHLPWLPLEARGPFPPPADGQPPPPRAVIHQHRLCTVNAAARAQGLDVGMSTATALSLCPGLQQLQRDEAAEAAFVRLLAMALSCYTPQVVLRADAVLLEVSGSLRLFGGLPGLAARLRRSLQQVGAHVRIGMAPTAAAAWLLARVVAPGAKPGRARTLPAAQRLLDGLPLPPVLQSLDMPPRLAELLQGIGCHTLADVRALPRTGLQRRGGGALQAALDRAYGDAPDPQVWFEPPLQFELACELVHRADDAAMLVFAAQRLVQPLAGWLSRQWLAAARCTLWLQHESSGRQARAPTPVRLAMGEPTRDAAQLLLLLRERLQRTELPAPVYGLRLQLDEAVALAGHEGRLALASADGQLADTDPLAVSALVDRLSARLGPERVLRLSVEDDHRPERAMQAAPALQVARRQPRGTARPAAAVGGSRGAPGATPAGPVASGAGLATRSATASAAHPADLDTTPPPMPTRPTWLLPQPLPLAEQNGRPVHGGPLVLRTRAERIESGWFDEALICRDYHVAEGRDHRLRWVFRERRQAAEGEPASASSSSWYLHGLFG